MRRLDNGAPLRAAMTEAGLSVRALAAATKTIDPAGKGVSNALVGHISGEGASARDTIEDANALLIAETLRKPLDSLFTDDASFAVEVSTISARSEIRAAAKEAGIECMVDARTLSAVIGKSLGWVYEQPALHPKGSATPFPVHYAGKSPRYYVTEIVAWMDAVHVAELAAAAA